jgi:uncharacterized protein (TIGR02145 family)
MNKNIISTWLCCSFLACILISCKKKDVPIIITGIVTDIRGNTAVCGGKITDDGGDSITTKGVCWSTDAKPTIADHKTIESTTELQFESTLSALSAGYKYHVRAYATNATGTGYGEDKTFTTAIMDFDGNVYNTVTIGLQTWMVENLKVTNYDVGIPLLEITDKSVWATTLFQAYCWYDNDSSAYKDVYGALYNWYAVNSRSICPFGWHIPNVAEWDELINYLGGPSVGGGKLKETGLTHWFSPNTGATNESGFTALPTGKRSNVGEFTNMGSYCTWWCDYYDPGTVYAYTISYDKASIIKYPDSKNSGFPVRCIRDH